MEEWDEISPCIDMELVSIVVPVYNVEKYLDKCVDSLINQTYSNIEIVLIDDGATDNSGILCDKWACKDKRVRVIHTENQGLSAARNVGIRNSSGKFLSFVDSDDWLEPEMIEILVRNMCLCNADISSCGVKKDYDEQKILLQKKSGYKLIKQKQMFHEILCNEMVYGYVCNKLFIQDIIKEIRFDEKLFSQEDMDFTMKYLERCKNCVYTEAEYYHYRQRRESMTGELGYSSRKLSIIEVYERAMDIYKVYCSEDMFVVERNYLKLNINILGRMKVSKYKNPELKKKMKSNVNLYYKKVLKNRHNSFGVKINIIISYLFPKTMIKMKQKLISQRRNA